MKRVLKRIKNREFRKRISNHFNLAINLTYGRSLSHYYIWTYFFIFLNFFFSKSNNSTIKIPNYDVRLYFHREK